VKKRRAAVVMILLAVLLSGVFATRLMAKPNPADLMPMPVVEQS
jgi:tRNA (Thr-GGU) A37 N-methylase